MPALFKLIKRGTFDSQRQPTHGPRVVLPDKYRFSHEFTMDLHDYLVEILAYADRYQLWNVAVAIREEPQIAQLEEAILNERIVEWLGENGFPKEAGSLLLRRVFPALLSDFCAFLFEALKCSERGKLTISFALLRKPFRENLLYMEMLLADPEGSLCQFANQPIESMQLGSLLGNKQRVVEIIKSAANRTLNTGAFQPEFIWEIRYDKKVPYGYDSICNKALHLVTTRTNPKTEDQNFNFIFSSSESHDDQWDHIYSTLPYLTFYAASVISVLACVALDDLLPSLTSKWQRQVLGFILWGRRNSSNVEASETLSELELKCPTCRYMIKEQADLMHLYQDWILKCPECQRDLEIKDLFAEG